MSEKATPLNHGPSFLKVRSFPNGSVESFYEQKAVYVIEVDDVSGQYKVIDIVLTNDPSANAREICKRFELKEKYEPMFENSKILLYTADLMFRKGETRSLFADVEKMVSFGLAHAKDKKDV